MRYLKWIALLQVYFLKFLPINLHSQAALAITVANNMKATHSDHNYFAMHRKHNAETPSTTALWCHDQAVDHQSWNMVFLVFQEDLTSKQTAKSIIPHRPEVRKLLLFYFYFFWTWSWKIIPYLLFYFFFFLDLKLENYSLFTYLLFLFLHLKLENYSLFTFFFTFCWPEVGKLFRIYVFLDLNLENYSIFRRLSARLQ